LRTLRAGNRRHDGAHIKVQRVGVDRRIILVTPEAVLFRVSFDQGNPVFVTARVAQVAECFAVNREEATGRTIFRRHVGDCRAIRQWQNVQTRAVEFNEFANNAKLAQHLDHFQNKVGACRAFDHLACELKTDNLWDQHRYGLAQHRSLGLDPANAPAQNGQTVDHCGVAVCANKRVGVCHLFPVLVLVGPNGLRQILQVHLVADPGGRCLCPVAQRGSC